MVKHYETHHKVLQEQQTLNFGKRRVVKITKTDKETLTEMEAAIICENHLSLDFFNKYVFILLVAIYNFKAKFRGLPQTAS